MKRKQLLDVIDNAFAVWRTEVRSAAKQNRNDTAVQSEAIVMRVLNAVYGWSLINANEGGHNQPAVDLLDRANGVAVQVTATPTSRKVQDTLNRIAKVLRDVSDTKPRLDGIKRFCVFILTNKQDRYRVSVPNGIAFDASRDVLDMDDVLRVLSTSAALSTIEAVHNVVVKEFLDRHNVAVLRGNSPESALSEAAPSLSPAAHSLASLDRMTSTECGSIVDGKDTYDLSDLYVERDIEDDLRDSTKGLVVLAGGSGTGKTSILWRLRQRCRQASRPTLLLRSDYLATTDREQLFNALCEIASVDTHPMLLVDGGDTVLARHDMRPALVQALDAAELAGWTITLACRTAEAGLYLPDAAKVHVPIEYSDSELEHAIEKHARCFYHNPSLHSRSAVVNTIVASISHGHQLGDIARQPLLLRMLFSLYAPDEVPQDINAWQLYDEFWSHRVLSDVRAGSPEPVDNTADCSPLAEELALQMLERGTASLPFCILKPLLPEIQDGAHSLDRLLSRGVLQRVGESGNTAVQFFHQSFLEHAAARALFKQCGARGIERLVERLRAVPEDYFRAPVLRHGLSHLLASGARKDVVRILTDLLTNGPIHLMEDAAAAYTANASMIDEIDFAFQSTFENQQVARTIVRCASSTPRTRESEVWGWLDQVLARHVSNSVVRKSRHAIRRAVVRQLARLASRSSECAQSAESLLVRRKLLSDVESDELHEVLAVLSAIGIWNASWAVERLDSILAAFVEDREQNLKGIAQLVVTLAHYPLARSRLDEDLPTILHAAKDENKARVCGFVRAASWRDAGLELSEVLNDVGSADELDALAGLAPWATVLRGGSDLDRLWKHFVSRVDDPGQKSWVHFVWDRLGLDPLDTAFTPSANYRDFLIGHLVNGLSQSSDTARCAAVAVCRYSRSFDLRLATLRGLVTQVGSDVVAADGAWAANRFGYLLGPAVCAGIVCMQMARDILASAESSMITTFRSDADELLHRAPRTAQVLLETLVDLNDIGRAEKLLCKEDIQYRDGTWTDILSTKVRAEVESTNARRRQSAARLAYLLGHRRLVEAIGANQAVELIGLETDHKVQAWLAMYLSTLSASVGREETVHLLEEHSALDEHVRDKVFDAYVAFVLRMMLPDAATRLVRVGGSPAWNLRRLRTVFCAAPQLAESAPSEADRLVVELLTRPLKVGTAVLGSLWNEAKKPLLRWSQTAGEEALNALLQGVPLVHPKIGRLIVDLLVRPPLRPRYLRRIAAIAKLVEVPEEVRAAIPGLIAARESGSEVAFWCIRE